MYHNKGYGTSSFCFISAFPTLQSIPRRRCRGNILRFIVLKFRKFLTCKFQLVRLNKMSQFIRPVDKHVEDFTRPRY